MTRAGLQTRTEQHGQAPALRPPSCFSPAAGPSVPADAKRPEPALLGILGNPDPRLSLPDRRPVLNRSTQQPG
jgi:hypothetical protein